MEPLPAKTQATLLAADKGSSALAPADASSAAAVLTLASSTSPRNSSTSMLQRLPSASRLVFDTPEPSSGHRALLEAIADFKRRKTLDNADASKQ
jgi:hypothetical protein